MLRLAVFGFPLLLAACASAGGEMSPQPLDAPSEPFAETDVFRLWIETRAGTGAPVHWMSEGAVHPPVSLEEVRQLQQGEAGPGWGQ